MHAASDKFDFTAVRTADRFWAPVIIFMFTLMVSFILINFFLTIIIEAYLRVRCVARTRLTSLAM